MKILSEKTYQIFWFLIPVILFFCFRDSDSTISINIHDMYFVIAYFHLGIFVSSIFAFIGFIYWVLLSFNRKTNKWMTMIHTILTIGGILLITFSNSIFENGTYISTHDHSYFDSVITANFVIAISVIIVVFGQLFLCINCLIGILKKEK